MTEYVKVGSSWREAEQQWVKIGSSWREVDTKFVKVGSSWREAWKGGPSEFVLHVGDPSNYYYGYPYGGSTITPSNEYILEDYPELKIEILYIYFSDVSWQPLTNVDLWLLNLNGTKVSPSHPIKNKSIRLWWSNKYVDINIIERGGWLVLEEDKSTTSGDVFSLKSASASHGTRTMWFEVRDKPPSSYQLTPVKWGAMSYGFDEHLSHGSIRPDVRLPFYPGLDLYIRTIEFSDDGQVYPAGTKFSMSIYYSGTKDPVSSSHSLNGKTLNVSIGGRTKALYIREDEYNDLAIWPWASSKKHPDMYFPYQVSGDPWTLKSRINQSLDLSAVAV